MPGTIPQLLAAWGLVKLAKRKRKREEREQGQLAAEEERKWRERNKWLERQRFKGWRREQRYQERHAPQEPAPSALDELERWNKIYAPIIKDRQERAWGGDVDAQRELDALRSEQNRLIRATLPTEGLTPTARQPTGDRWFGDILNAPPSASGLTAQPGGWMQQMSPVGAGPLQAPTAMPQSATPQPWDWRQLPAQQLPWFGGAMPQLPTPNIPAPMMPGAGAPQEMWGRYYSQLGDVQKLRQSPLYSPQAAVTQALSEWWADPTTGVPQRREFVWLLRGIERDDPRRKDPEIQQGVIAAAMAPTVDRIGDEFQQGVREYTTGQRAERAEARTETRFRERITPGQRGVPKRGGGRAAAPSGAQKGGRSIAVQWRYDPDINAVAGALSALAKDKTVTATQVLQRLREKKPNWPEDAWEWMMDNYFWGRHGRAKAGSHKAKMSKKEAIEALMR